LRYFGTIRAYGVVAVCAMVAACTPPDLAYWPVALQAPYKDWPDPPPGTAIEAGKPVKLDSGQQEAVVVGVLKWMKTPKSSFFGDMAAVKNRTGSVTVCGAVSGKNDAGVDIGMAPFIGVIVGQPATPEFVVVEIGGFGKQREDVETLCRESGVLKPV
jgi:hypothetical protein